LNAETLLARLAQLNVSIHADGDRLRLQPASMIPSGMLIELRQHKAEILANLSGLIDLGVLPDRPCPECGGGLWWRLATCEPGGPGPWGCERCDRPPPDVWRDACAVPVPRKNV
jgi:hypothetical protein